MFFFGTRKSVDDIVSSFTAIIEDLREAGNHHQEEADRQYSLSVNARDKSDFHGSEKLRATAVADKIEALIQD